MPSFNDEIPPPSDNFILNQLLTRLGLGSLLPTQREPQVASASSGPQSQNDGLTNPATPTAELGKNLYVGLRDGRLTTDSDGGPGLIPFGNFSQGGLPDDPSLVRLDNNEARQAASQAQSQADNEQDIAKLQALAISGSKPQAPRQLVGEVGVGMPAGGPQEAQESPRKPRVPGWVPRKPLGSVGLPRRPNPYSDRH